MSSEWSRSGLGLEERPTGNSNHSVHDVHRPSRRFSQRVHWGRFYFQGAWNSEAVGTCWRIAARM